MKRELKLYNTLTRSLETFHPLNPPLVTFYSCGPTVYDYTHIGHMRTFVNNDFLKRVLLYLDYKVKHVINITDVGHLTGDSDIGEDKLEKGAKKTGKTVWEVSKYYTDFFLKTLKLLNIVMPDYLPRATDNINEMIKIDEILEKKGFTYETKEALYFDVSKFKNYGRLSGQKLEEKIQGAREEVYIDKNKKHPADFSLWFKRVGRFKNHTMHWQSPWGDGFPGWHIECTAMSTKYLGKTIDIHSGGVEHIPIHHENEIAQAEAAFGVQFVRYWVHFQHLLMDGKKMSKSLGNFYTIDDILKNKINPISLRLFFAQAHYRQAQNFTWKAVKSADNSYQRLKEIYLKLKEKARSSVKLSGKAESYKDKFISSITNDLQLPQALAILWEVVKDKTLATEEKLELINDFDKVLGLNLNQLKKDKIDSKVILLAQQRQEARQIKDYKKADELRKKIEALGYKIEDVGKKFELKRK